MSRCARAERHVALREAERLAALREAERHIARREAERRRYAAALAAASALSAVTHLLARAFASVAAVRRASGMIGPRTASAALRRRLGRLRCSASMPLTPCPRCGGSGAEGAAEIFWGLSAKMRKTAFFWHSEGHDF